MNNKVEENVVKRLDIKILKLFLLEYLESSFRPILGRLSVIGRKYRSAMKIAEMHVRLINALSDSNSVMGIIYTCG